MSNSVHQKITFDASAKEIYAAMMDADKHAAFTGSAANIEAVEGAAFTAHSGGVEGRNIELLQDKLIVQAWRGADWPKAFYSVVKIELEDKGQQCELTLDHTGCPDDSEEHLTQGWAKMYWEPLKSWLAKA